MAEAVGAFYAIETLAEGAAAGALAVSGSTVPLHGKFQQITSPSNSLAVKGATASIIKNKVYVVGGEQIKEYHAVQRLSFPPDFGSTKTETNDPVDIDYELRTPELIVEQRPLQTHTERLERDVAVTKEHSYHSSFARTQHASVTVDDKLYILGGLTEGTLALRKSNTGNINPLDIILAYDTLTDKYSVLAADPSKCTEGFPESRYSASCTASTLPSSISAAPGQGPSLEAHGTIFLHGGYDIGGQPLHDTWSFDIGTRAWHKFPTILEEALKNQSRPGRIVYVDGRLWYLNASIVMYLELAEHSPGDDDTASNNPATLSTGRVGTGQWQMAYPPAKVDPLAQNQPSDSSEQEKLQTAKVSQQAPSDVATHIVPITTGAGRMYLLTLGSTNPHNMYLFQIPSSAKTAASIKDIVRDKATESLPNLPVDWRSGKHEWSKVEVIQSSMTEGEIEMPSQELEDFAVAPWEEYGDKFIIWGGGTKDNGAKNGGWIIHLD